MRPTLAVGAKFALAKELPLDEEAQREQEGGKARPGMEGVKVQGK